MNAVRAVLVVCLAGVCACKDLPGEARIQIHDPASAEPGWERTVPAQQFIVEQDAPDDVLRLAATDYCWTTTLVMDLERSTGKALSVSRRGASAGVGGPVGPLDPPTGCESGFALQRRTLSSGERVDLCGYTSQSELAVVNVAEGRERFRLGLANFPLMRVAGDYLLIPSLEPAGLDTYSLLSGEKLWSWTAPEPYTYLAGADAERVYLLAETSRESYAFALADGTAVWQKNLACDSLSLAGDLLVCQETLRASGCDHD